MPKSILSSGQLRLAWAVLGGSGFLLANAAYLWLFQPDETGLSAFYQWQLILHVVIGILLLVPLTIFVVWHLKRALAMRNPRANWSGIAVTAAMAALLFTGLFMFDQANSAQNRWAYLVHEVLAVAVPLGYVFHRLVARNPPTRARIAKGSAVVALAVIAFAVAHSASRPAPRPAVQELVPRPKPGEDPYKDAFPDHGVSGAPADSVFAPAATTTQTGEFLTSGFLVNDDWADQEQLKKDVEEHGFAVEARLGARTCAKCHADTVEQWARSAHRYSSFNNPFYRASVDGLREADDGKRRSQWCAGCHDPAVMMVGNMLEDLDPMVPASQAGLTCLTCHAMDQVHGVGGNGNYRIADLHTDPYLFKDAKGGLLAEINELLVKSKPDVHKRDLLKPVMRTAEYCATCHKVSLDEPINRYRWIRGQNQYDSWHDSGVARNNARTFYLPDQARKCQDCHMPLVDAPLGDLAADENGLIRSHAFLAANTALPHIRGDQETVEATQKFLRTAASVDVFAVKRGDDGGPPIVAPDLRPVPLTAGEQVEFQVVVRNRGTGHRFPAGTNDSNEVWVHVTVFDADRPDEPLFESGALDPESRFTDPGSHFYRVVFVDERSEAMLERNAHDFRAAVLARSINPGTADIVRYTLRVPPELSGRRLGVRARLRYRKFDRAYTEFTYRAAMPGRAVPELPITDIAEDEVVFPVTAQRGDIGALPRRPDLDVVRWNDWGIGLLLQGDTVGALQAFEFVRDAWRDRPDGWRNLARTHLLDGNVDAALAALQEADRLAPADPQTAFFFGVAREASGQLEDAVAAYEIARAAFPEDRTIHRKLGDLRFRLGRHEESLQDALAVLRIDPEDRFAHYLRYRNYAALGDEFAADAAEKAYLKFKLDESAQKWTNEYRRKNPDVNRESQAIHVHELERLDR